MNKQLFLKSDVRRDYASFVYLAVISSAFLCGCVIGSFCAGYVDADSAVYRYLNAFISAGADGLTTPGFLSVVMFNSAFFVASFVCGFSSLGVISIPLLSAARGFCITFTVAAVIRVFGKAGILLSVSLCGFGLAVTLPCLFVFMCYCLQSSYRLIKFAFGRYESGPPVIGRPFFVLFFACVAGAFVASLIDTYLSSYLVRLSFKLI